MKLPSFSKSADAYAIPPSLTAAAAALEELVAELLAAAEEEEVGAALATACVAWAPLIDPPEVLT